MAQKKEFVPKLFTLLKEGINGKQFSRDVMSGIIVGIVALPLAIAFAIASGVSPEKGLITAVVAGFIISAFGGSRVQIGGPTGAFIIIVYGIVQQHGMSGLIIATFLAGFILIGLGLARLGNYLKYIPYPLVVGFTSGIALIIFSSQVNDFLGLNISNLPSDFIGKWNAYFQSAHHINLYATALAVFSLISTKFFSRITTKVPGSIIAIIISTLAVQLFQLPVETIQSKFGDIPTQLAMPQIPSLSFETVKSLIQPALAIAVLGAIESLLSAVVADGMIGGKHRSNIELIAQGAANIFSGLFGGIPATGAIARTATNVKNGGRTPIAGIVHALTLLLIMLFFAPYAKLIPLSALAGILIVIAYNMSEWRQFKSLLKSNRMDIIVLLSTFFLTVIFDLIIAIEVGLVLSSVLFMKRMSDSVQVESLGSESDEEEMLFQDELHLSQKEVMLYEINGPLFFGAAQQFQDAVRLNRSKPKYIILRLRYVPFIDATGYLRMKEIIRNFRLADIHVILSGVSPQLLRDFEKNDLFSVIRKECVFNNIEQALKYLTENSQETEGSKMA